MGCTGKQRTFSTMGAFSAHRSPMGLVRVGAPLLGGLVVGPHRIVKTNGGCKPASM